MIASDTTARYIDSRSHERNVRSLAQWSRASEVLFSKRRAPQYGRERKMWCWDSMWLGGLLVDINMDININTCGVGMGRGRVYPSGILTPDHHPRGMWYGRISKVTGCKGLRHHVSHSHLRGSRILSTYSSTRTGLE